jgi:hypothetical protein
MLEVRRKIVMEVADGLKFQVTRSMELISLTPKMKNRNLLPQKYMPALQFSQLQRYHSAYSS